MTNIPAGKLEWFCQKATRDSTETSSVTVAKGDASAYTQEMIGFYSFDGEAK